MGPCWGCPGEKRGLFICPWAMGWFFLYCHFSECVLPLAFWPGRLLQAQGATNAGLFTLFGWKAGLGTKLAHKLRFSHFISRAANFRALKMVLWQHWERWWGEPKSMPSKGHAAFRIISQSLKQLLSDCQSDAKGRRVEWLYLVRLYVKII